MSKRKLLIVSPHFPPIDTVDMHRVRMNIRYYGDYGFEPTVLAVKPKFVDRRYSDEMVHTLPEYTRVIHTNAIPSSVTKPFGITDIAIRAMNSLASTGDKLLKNGNFDLIFFSTTAFLCMRLGQRWERKFGVPFVLDMQDPWFTAPPSSETLRRKGFKHSLMRSLHARTEAATMPHASGLIAVSEAYIEALQDAYPALSMVPADTIPFGNSGADFEVAKKVGVPWRPFDGADSTAPVALYAGRVNEPMHPALNALFKAMKLASGESSPALANLRTAFLGTGYLREGNPRVVEPLANAAGLGERVAERPDRVSLLDSLSSLLAADLLIILGSTDLAYQPSKLYQLMATGKPVLCIAPSGGRLATQVRDLKSVVLIESDRPMDVATVTDAAAKLSALLKAGRENPVLRERDPICWANDAAALAARECALFDRAIQYHAKAEVSQ